MVFNSNPIMITTKKFVNTNSFIFFRLGIKNDSYQKINVLKKVFEIHYTLHDVGMHTTTNLIAKTNFGIAPPGHFKTKLITCMIKVCNIPYYEK